MRGGAEAFRRQSLLGFFPGLFPSPHFFAIAKIWGDAVGARARPWQRKSLRKLEERDNIPLWRLVKDSDEEVGSVKFTRITVNPRQMGGVPCIRGLRIPVSTVVGMVADGMTEEEILAAYPDLEREDIREALRYAAEALRERELPFVTKP